MPISFEYIKEKNPDWLFVLDRSAAIGEEGKAAKDVLDNPLVAESTAWKKGQVVYLDSSAYLAAGGAQQLQTVAKQAAEAFKKGEINVFRLPQRNRGSLKNVAAGSAVCMALRRHTHAYGA